MKVINIQSISDLITNSSTEVFVIYDESNIDSIKKLVNAILSLVDPSKTFDDYFNIKMLINYHDLIRIFEDYGEEFYEDLPEFEAYQELGLKAEEFVSTMPLDKIKEIFEYANKSFNCDEFFLYEGFAITAKEDNPIVQRVAEILNGMDKIFDIDFINNY